MSSSSKGGSSSTAGISRDHIIFSEPDGMVTITGGVHELTPRPETKLHSSK